MMMSATKDETIALNAAPMINATPKSMILPLSKKALIIITYIHQITSFYKLKEHRRST